jgi:O-acetylserine/cysteine efflux transporter
MLYAFLHSIFFTKNIMAIKHLLLGILVAAIWGANFSVIRLGLAEVDPFALACARFALSAFPLILLVPRPSTRLRHVAGYGALFGGGLWGLVNLGIHAGVPAGLASLLLQLSAFFTIVLASLVLGERIGRQQWLGMAIAGLGLAIILGSGGGASPWGMALILAAALAWAVCNVIVRQAKPADMFAFLVWACAFATLALVALTLCAKGTAPFTRLGASMRPAVLFSIGFQAWVTTLFGYWVWNSLMKTYPVSQVAPLSLLVPVAGLLTSHLVYGEPVGGAKLVAALCILSGIAVMFFGSRMLSWRRAQAGCTR